MKNLKLLLLMGILFVMDAHSQKTPTSFLLPTFTNENKLDRGYEDPILDFKKIVGTINGEYTVNENGAAVYSIPLLIPPGSGGMLPNVNIVYNSQSGDGYLGKGWNISGFSSISRMAKTFYLDNKVEGLQFDNTDHFVLDGNVLIPIIGSNGANGTEYRTEVETFSQIFSYCASGSIEPDYFIVHTKDGRIIEYGNTSNNTSNSRQYLPGLSKTLCWAVNKISDANTNYILFSYNYDNANGKFYPDKIEYTGNDNLPQLPYNTIKFVFSNFTPAKISYLYGTKFTQNVRMNEIQVYNEGSLVRRYELTYETDFKTMLKKITEYNNAGESYNPTIFNYTSRGVIEFGYWYPDLNIYTPGGVGFSWNEDHPRQMADVNGDGMADIVGFEYSNVYVSLSNGHGYELQQEWYHYDFCIASGWLTNISDPNTDETHSRQLIDVNGDGMADIVGFSSDGVWVALSNGAEFDDKQKWISYFAAPIVYGKYLNETIAPRFLVDVNGDKLPDIVGFSPIGVEVAINTGSNFIKEPQWYNSFWGGFSWIDPQYCNNCENPDQLIRTMADVNGDGMADIVGFGHNDVFVSLSTGTGFEVPVSWISNAYCYDQSAGTWDKNSTPRYVQDVNGDGMADIVGFGHSEVSVALSNGLNSFIPQGTWHDYYDTDAGFSNNSNDQFPRYLADVNGDGLPDIVGFPHVGTVYSLNTGTSFLPAVILASGSYGFDDFGGTTTHIRTIADVNGDGRADIVGFGHDKVVTAISRLDDDRKIEKITNGLGFRVGCSYQPIVNNTSVYHYTGHENYPFLKFAASLKVVNTFSIENGIGGFNTTNYEYQDAMAHLKGKGFLGFGKITTNNNDNINNIISTSVKDYSFDYSYCFKSLFNLQTWVNANLASTTTYAYDVFPNLNKSIIYFTGLCVSTSIDDILKNKLTKEFCLDSEKPPLQSYPGYDLWGNPHTIRTTSTNLSNNTVDLIQTEEISYNSSGSWCDSKPVYIRTTKEKPGDPILNIREKAYVYDNINGNIRKDISDPNDAKTTAIVLDDYDKFGNFRNKTLTTLSSNQLADITNIYEYDSKGRFLTKKTNPIGHFLTNKYETKFGNLLQSIDENGLITKYEYDDFGSLKLIDNTSEGTSTQFGCEWITTIGSTTPSYALYQTKSISSCEPDLPSIAIYDKLTRELQSEDINFNDKKIFTNKEYNNRGNVVKISLPYIEGINPFWTNITYDEYDRKLHQINTDLSTVHINYNVKETTVVTTKNGDSEQQINTANSLNQTIQTIDNIGIEINNTYYSSGLIKNTMLGTDQLTLTSFEYDLQGRRLSITEPNSGTTNTEYDAYGQVISQTDARSNTVNMEYDLLGRITKKKILEGNIYYLYDAEPNTQQALPQYIGKISTITSDWNGTVRDEFYYDILGRSSKSVEIVDGNQYEESKDYDVCGRLDKLTYPDNFVIQHIYKNGQLHQVRNVDGDQLIWQANVEDNFGNITDFELGNGITTSKSFESNTGRLTDIKTSRSNNYLQNWHYDYDNFGNIVSRADNVTSQYEGFGYDNNRLADIYNPNSNPTNKNIDFDIYGNITKKYGVGNYTYDPIQINAVTKIEDNPYTIPKSQDITYTSFNKVMHISEEGGTDQVDFIYGPDYSRRLTSYTNNNNNIIKKYFVGGNYEEETNSSTGEKTRDHYIYAGDGLAAIYRYTESNNTGSIYYIHSDHLGSFDRITDFWGNVVDSYSFDAWGNRRDASNWTNPDASTHLFARGYTGHEHLDKFGIINMNGRLYDPLLGRFLSPDNYVQAPDNSQNYNRYSYCLNNPLKYTDPNGELFWMVIPAIAGIMNLAANANNIHNFGQGLSFFGIGFASGAIGAGVSSMISTAIVGGIGFASGSLVGAGGGFAGGFVGGACNAWAGGASFGQGLQSGLVSGGWGALGGAIIGGISGEISYQKQMLSYRLGCSELGVIEGEPVPATDEFLSESQKVWYKDAPMDKVLDFTVEKVPQNTFTGEYKFAGGMAVPEITNGTISGNSHVYFNKLTAFTNARTLFGYMGHELVHVSQISSLAGLSKNILGGDFHQLMEYHAYSYNNAIGTSNMNSFSPGEVKALYTKYPSYFKSLNYTNFNWTNNHNFKYPF